MRRAGQRASHGDGIRDELVAARLELREPIHERRVGPVLEQAADEIRQQVLVAADRCVDAAPVRESRSCVELAVELLAHAVQTLQLERAPGADLEQPSDRVRVMRRELRIERRVLRQQRLRAREIRDVRVALAREHGVAGEAELLRALDLAVPVGAFDEPDGDRATAAARERAEPIEHVERALLVRLHGYTQTRVVREPRVAVDLAEDRQRQLEPVCFFGVDGQPDAGGARGDGQLGELRAELANGPRALRDFVTRAKCRQLHGDARRVEQRARTRRAAADRSDRRAVGREVPFGIGGGQRRFAEHVERVVELGILRRAVQGALDRFAHHELKAQDPHRLSQRRAYDGLPDALDEPREERRRRLRDVRGPHDAARQQQRPSGSVDEQRVARAQVRLPIRRAELVGDQPIRGIGIGNAQQRFGQAHQYDAFAGREVVLAQ